jgi:hypothetical protein
VTASIVACAAPLDEAGCFKLVDRRDQPAGIQAEGRAQLLLGGPVGQVDRVHHGELLGPQPQRLQQLDETGRLSAANRAQQVGDPSLERASALRGSGRRRLARMR